MRQYSHCKSIALAINSDAPRLSVLKRQLGVKSVEAYLKLWLIDLNAVLDLRKPLTETQIDDLAFRIVENYRSLNIADVNLIFAQVKNGELGKVYDRLSIPTVMKWFKDYFDKRCSAAAEQSYQNHAQAKVQMRTMGDSLASTHIEKQRKAMKVYGQHQAQQRINNAKK
ncbi:hypothetical protein GGR32_000155 [Mesonia hippocampi]|uniref:Uncharacterized protein n=1 Tax=Mesonia hippocampi TaxID=1628250 RepID=A0A840EMM0_9FLAO|nr:hypothetical protein [Mesonia hippocampi]MBB4117883.1 hypothetical protein [Mesonia hippocampi]